MAYVYNVADGQTYWQEDSPSPDQLAAQQAEQQALQQQVLDWYKNQGFDAFVPQVGQQYDRWGSTGGLYNAGNGVMAYVPTEGAAAEPFIAKPQQNSGFSNFAMGPIGTTLTHFQDVRNAYKENPERLLYGGGFADSPLGTQGLNAVLGTDYKPLVNQTGGPTSQTYNNAAAQGYETGPTQVGHQLAPAIVGIGAASALAGTSGGIPLGAEEGALAAAGQGSATGATTGGTVAGVGEGTAVGNAGTDTLGANMGDEFLYDPSYYDAAGDTSFFQTSPEYAGNNFDPGYMYDSSGNYAQVPGVQAPSGGGPGGLFQQAKDLAAQFGITPASALNWLKGAVARGAPGVVGAVGAAKQADALKGLSNQYLDFGAPSRMRYEASYMPGFSMSADAGFKDALDQTTKSFLHKASIGGNPADSPNAWQQTMKDVFSTFAYPALQNYRALNADTGGISRLTAAAPGLATSAVGAQKGIYDALGGAAADIFNPPTDLMTAIKTLKAAGG